MAQMAVTGEAAAPMPARISAWAIYDVFAAAGEEQFFLAVVSDSQWQTLCEAFDLRELRDDPSLATNNERVAARDRILPRIRDLLSQWSLEELLTRFEAIGIPAARIARPEDLFDDPHLNAAGGLVGVTIADTHTVRLPALPVEMDGARFGVRRDLAQAGADSRDVLRELGMSAEQTGALIQAGIVQ